MGGKSFEFQGMSSGFHKEMEEGVNEYIGT
jgi:hypothetical protein